MGKEMSRLSEMLAVMGEARPEVRPSNYWVELNNRNLQQLWESGYENFKRTVAFNYFTWQVYVRDLIFFRDPQIKYLTANLPLAVVLKDACRAVFSKQHSFIPLWRSVAYNFLTYLLWDYASKVDRAHLLEKLSEPLEGNPPDVRLHGKLISQDLANSVLEYKAITEAGIDVGKIHSIMELGAGYGRTAYVFLSLMEGAQYIIADIPPALYIAERYLSNQFPNKNIFKFRRFQSYHEVEKELRDSDIAFLMPHQLELLPDRYVDLFINISSLHEMRKEQIDYYFRQIDRLTKHFMFIKEWKVSRIPYDNVVITEGDYPIPRGWRQVYWRDCAVQTRFFEALFERADDSESGT